MTPAELARASAKLNSTTHTTGLARPAGSASFAVSSPTDGAENDVFVRVSIDTDTGRLVLEIKAFERLLPGRRVIAPPESIAVHDPAVVERIATARNAAEIAIAAVVRVARGG